MQHVQATILGDESKDQQVAFAAAIFRMGFSEDVIAICVTCNRVEEMTLNQAADRAVSHTWPYCHNKRMVMADPDDAPPF